MSRNPDLTFFIHTQEQHMTPEDIATNVSSMKVEEGFIGSTTFTQSCALGGGFTIDDANHFGN